MKIKKFIRVGQQTFGPGQEEQLLEHASAFPEQLDFIRLLNMDCIDEMPVTEDLDPAARKAKQERIMAEQEEKIRYANQKAQEQFELEQSQIKEAHRVAEIKKAKANRQVEKEIQVNTAQDNGEGEEGDVVKSAE